MQHVDVKMCETGPAFCCFSSTNEIVSAICLHNWSLNLCPVIHINISTLVCRDTVYPECSTFLKAVRWLLSFCAHENVSLCFTSWAFINHSSALCFVTDNITATSWQREDERTERQREKEYFFPFSFFSFAATISFVLESENWTSEHLQLPWRVNGLVLWLGRNDLRNEEAKQTQKKNGREKKQHPQTECL